MRRRYGDVTLDLRNGWLIAGAGRINVRPAVARLLDALMVAKGQTQTAETLRAAMRKSPAHPPVSKENLRVGVVDLRAALAGAGARTSVEARIGYGWRLDTGGDDAGQGES
jgi:hypothetical protein